MTKKKRKVNDEPYYQQTRASKRRDTLDYDYEMEGEHDLPKRKRNVFGVILLILFLIVIVATVALLLLLNVLPNKYLIALALALFVLWLFALLTQLSHSGRGVGKVYMVVLLLIFGAATFYLWKTNDALNSIIAPAQSGYTSKISVVVLADEPIEGLQQLSGKTLGVQDLLDKESMDTTLSNLQSQVENSIQPMGYASYIAAVEALYGKQVDGILLNESFRSFILETFTDFDIKTKVLDAYTYEGSHGSRPNSDNSAQADIKVDTEPFTVYLCGNDSYGDVYDGGRTDVNILMTINPKSKEILLTTTPRDYYVDIDLGEGHMDKLTHAGWRGVYTSEAILSDLYDVDIDYYVRVNFTGFEGIVDALGGVNVYSDKSFTSVSGFSFNEGYNYVEGEAALAFVRERYAFADGDFTRGRNQMHMINAIIDKVTSPAILTSYASLMDSLSYCVMTDMPKDKISDLVKMQLNDNASWHITSQTVTGWFDTRYCYLGGMDLSVVMPDYDQLSAASEKIHAVERGEKLED